MASGLATINVKFKCDLRGFSTEIQSAMRSIGAFGAQMSSMGKTMSMYVTAPLLAGAGAAVKFASDYEESMNKVDVAFGDSSAQVKNFAKTTLESYGVAEGTALDLAATYGDMGTAMGLTQDKAAKMSTSLVGLAGDLASFKNIGIDQANTALTGIFSGETESLKKLGIIMTEANLQQFAYSKGIKVQIKDMDQAAKVNLRYAYVMNASKNAVGDFERTGGGAANQMRIFQESLKQVAQQFGTIILPAFTKAISYVNSLVKSFSGLSDESKTMIITIGAVVVSIGPLLSVFGAVLTFVPNVITKFNALKDSYLALKVALVANPFTAIAVGIAAIASIVLISSSRFRDLTNAQKDFTSINNIAVESIVNEKTALEKNLAIAKNKKFSDETRKKAIQDLNALSPEHLGNITLENIYTKQTTESVKKYTEAILQKAKVQAAEEKLVEVQKRLLDIQLGNLDAAKPTVWQNLGNAFLSAGSSMAFLALHAKTVGENLGTEIVESQKLINMLTLFIGKNKEAGDSTDALAAALAAAKAAAEAAAAALAFKPGTVAFYEEQIAGLQKLQKEIPTTNAAWLTYEKQIDAIQKKIEALTKAQQIKLPKPELPTASGFDGPVPAFSLEDLQGQLSYFEKLREQFSTTADEYEKLTGQINNTKIKINAIEGGDELNTKIVELSDTQKRMAEIAQLTGQSVSDAFSGMAGSLVESLGLAQNGFGGFISGLIQTVTKLVAMMLASAISQSIAGATASGTATGPAAIFTTPAFIATAVGGVLAAFAAIPKFATGGIFGGSSFYGDKILARVNSGEMVANSDQQKRIWGAMSGGSGSVVTIIPSIKIQGSDILVVFNRENERKNRLS